MKPPSSRFLEANLYGRASRSSDSLQDELQSSFTRSPPRFRKDPSLPPKAKRPSPSPARTEGEVEREEEARHYPVLLSLLKNPPPEAELEAVPPPPVPGTFEPHLPPNPAKNREDRPPLDELLSTMADGLLIGEGPDGSTEVRIPLRDEFFAGTELRFSLKSGLIFASLHPPSGEVADRLEEQMDELQQRLEARGLAVAQVEIHRP